MAKRRSAALPQSGIPAEPAKQAENQPPKTAQPSHEPATVVPVGELQQHSIAEKLGLKMGPDGNLDVPSLAYVLYSSKMFPDITSVSQGIVKITVGKELGLAPMQSVMGIHIIRDEAKNKTSIMIGAHLVAAKIKGSGRYDYDILEIDSQRCELQPYAKRDGTWRELKRVSYTVDEAKIAGLGQSYDTGQFKKGSNWAKDPQAMCFARAITRMEKMHFADLTGMPTYTPDELGYRTDADGNALVVKGNLVPDDISEEDLAKLKANDKPPNGPTVTRKPVGGLKLARLQQICKDKGWPLLGMLDMAFSINGYVNKEKAEQAWDAEATQMLLELIAEDAYEAIVKALDEAYTEWQKRTEGHPVDEAEAIIDQAKESVTKVTYVTKVTSEMSAAALESGAEAEEKTVELPKANGEEIIDRDQYNDLWAIVWQNPKLIQAAKEFAMSTLGYPKLKTLRDIKKKHLAAICDFAQRWGQP